jgi:hypothetical protein
MATLDQTRTAQPSAIWTGDRVKERLVEAFATEKRMPGQRFAAITSSSWPAAPLHEFADRVHWTDARQRVWESWEKSRGVYPYEVSRMEESFSWLRWLHDGERRCLAAWALASARGFSVRAMLDKRRWSRSTFYRRIDEAAQRIADRLNTEGVQVR